MDLVGTLNLKKRAFFSFKLKKFKLNSILFFIFLFGLIFGIMLFALNGDETVSQCGLFVNKFIEKRMSQPFFFTFFSSFLNYSIFIFLFFLIGFVPFSQICCLISPVFYGLGLGLATSYLFIFKNFNGILIFLTMILPCAVISIFVFIFSCKESLRFANKNFVKMFLKKSNLDYKKEFKIYLLKFLTLTFFQLIAALVDSIFTLVFVLCS